MRDVVLEETQTQGVGACEMSGACYVRVVRRGFWWAKVPGGCPLWPVSRAV